MADTITKSKADLLIVENEILIAADIKFILETLGYTICGLAKTGSAALELADIHRPDLVLMDIVLEGEMDGIETAEILRDRWGIPVVFLTAYADTASLERAKLVYPFGYLVKPVQSRDLMVALEMALYAAKIDNERRQAEQALKESEDKYKQLFDYAPSAIYEIDFQQNRVVAANEVAHEYLGYSREELLAMSPAELLSEQSQELLARRIQQMDEGMELPLQDEFEVIGKNGLKFWILTNIRFSYENGMIKSGSIVAHDITELKKAEQEKEELRSQLMQAKKLEAVGTLAGGIAHDFNNLLQAINGYTQVLLMDKTEENSDYLNLKAIQAAGNRAADLVKQLLLFSRRADSERKSVELNQEVLQAQKMLQRTIPKMIDVEVHLGSRLWTIEADPLQMEQVLLNLGINAADAMPEGGRFLIETENIIIEEEDARKHLELDPGRYVLLKVSDTGHGVDPENLEKIFEPFYTTKEIGKGTGLGLSSVYGIVKNHGGHINCSSEPGRGTTFLIYLPAAKKQDVSVQKGEIDEPAEGGAEKILIVDDEKMIRDFAAQALENYGYEILTASSGEEALEIYSANPGEIDLIIMDIGMPGMGGYKCLEKLIRLSPPARVLMASGYSPREQAGKTVDSGAAGFIGKPYALNDLLTKVRSVLEDGR